jgi:hypothetical protein
MDCLKQKERHLEIQHKKQQQQGEVNVTAQQQQVEQEEEEENTPPEAHIPAEASAGIEGETDNLIAYFDVEAGIYLWDNESNSVDHAVGEEEEMALQLVHFVEANAIVKEMETQGHNVGGPPQPTADDITDTIIVS